MSPSRRDAVKVIATAVGTRVLRPLEAVLDHPAQPATIPRSTSMHSSIAVKPFRIAVSDDHLADLRTRLSRARWADAIPGSGWDLGTDSAFLRDLATYWVGGYDWRAQERALNAMPQFTADINGTTLHFVHVRGKGPAPTPIVLAHGWPGSFYQMSKLIPRLTDPAAHGGDAKDAFDVVVPSIPGFGFSSIPTSRGMTVGAVAPLVDALMTEALGYRKYGAAGGDIGAGVVGQLAGQFPGHVLATQMNGGNPYIFQVPPNLTPAEQAFVSKAQQWMQAEGAYASLQSTKPQTVGLALNDSPIGLASWLIEKYRAWTDSGGDVLKRFTRDELLNFVMLYWVTGTITSSMRIYYEGAHDPAAWGPPPVKVAGPPPPNSLAVWPGDIAVPPREWAERTGPLARYSVMPRGGHFAEWEEPQLVAEELRTVFRPVRG